MTEAKQRRTVRSFVRRSGRLTTAQQRALQDLWPQFGIDFDGRQLDLDAVFGHSAPCVLEIGFGNGETLVEQARRNPDMNFLGIEVHEPGVGHCLLHIEAAAVTNLRVLCQDALEVMARSLADRCLARINLYFPDPWPKKRHHKRRILTPDFLNLCRRKLESGGNLHVATDWANYAEHIDALIAQSADFSCAERRQHDGSQPIDRPNTKFETRGLKKGHSIFDWRLSAI